MVLARGAESAEPRSEVCTEYNRRSQERLKTMVYSHPAVTSSYYKNSTGDLPTLFAWRIADYWRWTHKPDPDDYAFDYVRRQENS
jgi:4-hydroxyacetophenone monooxygenase